MTERIRQLTDEILRVQVTRGERQETMSLQRRGNLWILDGKGISGIARIADEVFVATLGIVDGKKAARRWNKNNGRQGGENYE
jgi:hypothetical protein